MEPIAYIRTDLPQKFGIPRQSGLADLAGRVEFLPEYAKPQAVQGLDGFSHLWLIWGFENGFEGGTANDVSSDTDAGPVSAEGVRTRHAGEWSAQVRPPRLGGARRVGVFATRSPFRPNPIGLSCVRLDCVEITDKGPVIHVLGADLRDGTPIYDIKPYLPYADCQPDATGGFTDAIKERRLQVECAPEVLEIVPAQKRAALLQVLELDPRPVGVDDPDREYHLAYAGLDVAFRVAEDALSVEGVAKA